MKAANSTAVTMSPGMPKLSRGMRLEPFTALLPVSAAATPSRDPFPNFSGCFDLRNARP